MCCRIQGSAQSGHREVQGTEEITVVNIGDTVGEEADPAYLQGLAEISSVWAQLARMIGDSGTDWVQGEK